MIRYALRSVLACDIPILHFSEKKWQFGFEPAKEVPLWRTIPCHSTSSLEWLHIIDIAHAASASTAGRGLQFMQKGSS